MTNVDFDDEGTLAKNSPLVLMQSEELEVHSVAVLKNRLEALKAEISRTERAIADKGDAKQSAESFFK